jgi:malate dehydrogenase (oxaloacetate-decarboxylating)
VAVAVAAAAAADGVARNPLSPDLTGQVRALMWQPVYRPVRPG